MQNYIFLGFMLKEELLPLHNGNLWVSNEVNLKEYAKLMVTYK